MIAPLGGIASRPSWSQKLRVNWSASIPRLSIRSMVDQSRDDNHSKLLMMLTPTVVPAPIRSMQSSSMRLRLRLNSIRRGVPSRKNTVLVDGARKGAHHYVTYFGHLTGVHAEPGEDV